MNEVVRLINVSKAFKQKTAVNNINFSINKGEMVAILGPNGAGKTTTIAMILDLLHPTTGNINIFGLSTQAPHDDGNHIKGNMYIHLHSLHSFHTDKHFFPNFTIYSATITV